MNNEQFSGTLRSAEKRLKEVGIYSAAAEVEIIMEYLLEVDRLQIYLHGAELIDEKILGRFEDIIKKRETRYPLQYILGEAYFYGRRFVISPDVMVPTPETELLCELAISYIKNEKIMAPEILDIGVGSGVISVTMAAELPNATITAVDLSEGAIKIARENARDHVVNTQIEFLQSDCFKNIKKHNRFDLILSNPPYISESEYNDLPPEVLADPKISLVSGEAGMDMIKQLILQAPEYLKPNGRLMFEIGYNQAELVSHASEKDLRYRSLAIMRDLNDVDRVAILSI